MIVDAAPSGLLDRLVLALLVFDGFLTAILAVLFLPLRVGGVPAPISALVAAVVNVLLVLGARSVTNRLGRVALPLLGWFLGFLLCLVGGPGGDALLLADWRTLVLLAAGLIPAAALLFTWSADASIARGQAARVG